MENKYVKKILIFVLLISILSLNVTAWGVTSFYTSPITMYPGQTQEVEYWLQNMADNYDITITTNVVKGSDIFSITDKKNEFFIKQGVKDLKVHGKIKIPEYAQTGEKYYVEIAFEEIASPTSSGPVALKTRVNKVFDVMVQEQPTQTSKFISAITPVLTIIGIFIIALVILYCFIRKEMKLLNKKKEIKRKK